MKIFKFPGEGADTIQSKLNELAHTYMDGLRKSVSVEARAALDQKIIRLHTSVAMLYQECGFEWQKSIRTLTCETERLNASANVQSCMQAQREHLLFAATIEEVTNECRAMRLQSVCAEVRNITGQPIVPKLSGKVIAAMRAVSQPVN